MLSSVLAISVGAGLGALLRWQLGLKLNTLCPTCRRARWLRILLAAA